MKQLMWIVILLFAVTFGAVAQDVVMMEAHAISVDSGKWVLCEPVIKIALLESKIKIFSERYQEYTCISVIGKGDGETEVSTTWLCLDKYGTNVWVTLGKLTTDDYGVYLLVKYSDHAWMYRGYLKD